MRALQGRRGFFSRGSGTGRSSRLFLRGDARGTGPFRFIVDYVVDVTAVGCALFSFFVFLFFRCKVVMPQVSSNLLLCYCTEERLRGGK